MKFSGTVVHGDGYGRQLGYPTANIDTIDYQKQELALAQGIYAGWVHIEGGEVPHVAAIVVSTQDGVVKIEAHVIDFEGDLYGQTVSFEILQFIRPYESYQDEEDLKSAIAEDLIKVRMVCTHL